MADWAAGCDDVSTTDSISTRYVICLPPSTFFCNARHDPHIILVDVVVVNLNGYFVSSIIYNIHPGHVSCTSK